MLDNYLYYSYNPGCKRQGFNNKIRSELQEDYKTKVRRELIDIGKRSLRRSFNNELDGIKGDAQHVIPLSSGLDSRILLALLLDHPDVSEDSITTVTFGVPGTWDFEISQDLSVRSGIKNLPINIMADDFDWSVSSLRAYVRKHGDPVRIFEAYVNSRVPELCPNDAVIWSGFMGDPTAGGHQPQDPSDSWDAACDSFVEANRFAEGICSPEFDPTDSLPDEPYLDRTHLSYEEQLDFAHRQPCLISPLVLPEPDRYCTPFMQPEWLSFSLNIPREYRKNRSLFKDLVVEMYPDLFSMPTDANYGLPLNTGKTRELLHRSRLFAKRNMMRAMGIEYLPPSANYLDFGRAFREAGQLRTTAETLIRDFSERGIADWIDPLEIWKAHQSGNSQTNKIRTICLVELIASETDVVFD